MRLGIVLGIIDVDLDVVDRLTTQIQPANLQKIYGKPLDSYERDVKRAEYVSQQLYKKQ